MTWESNTEEELETLVGSTILGFEQREDEYGDSAFARMHVRYRGDLLVNGSKEGFYEIWRDEEGNGPGYLALVGHEK